MGIEVICADGGCMTEVDSQEWTLEEGEMRGSEDNFADKLDQGTKGVCYIAGKSCYQKGCTGKVIFGESGMSTGPKVIYANVRKQLNFTIWRW
jgi:hypothetical protein